MGGLKRSRWADDSKDSYDNLGTLLEVGGMALGAYMAPSGSTGAATIQNMMSGMSTGAGLGRMIGGYANPSRSRGRANVASGMGLAAAGAKGLASGAKNERIQALARMANTKRLGPHPKGGFHPKEYYVGALRDMRTIGTPYHEAFNFFKDALPHYGINANMGYDEAFRVIEMQNNVGLHGNIPSTTQSGRGM